MGQLFPDGAQRLRRDSEVRRHHLEGDPLHDLGIGLQEVEVACLGGFTHQHQDTPLEDMDAPEQDVDFADEELYRQAGAAFHDLPAPDFDLRIFQCIDVEQGGLCVRDHFDVGDQPAFWGKHTMVDAPFPVIDKAAQQAFLDKKGFGCGGSGGLEDGSFGHGDRRDVGKKKILQLRWIGG